jgi:hypothetical protein
MRDDAAPCESTGDRSISDTDETVPIGFKDRARLSVLADHLLCNHTTDSHNSFSAVFTPRKN